MRHNPKLKSTLYLGKHCVDVLYYYHSDHIGSSTFLTDALGIPYEFMLYLPFGEAMAQQKVAGWGTPYTFTGKEQDAATGLHYYSLSRPQDGSARYLDTRLSIWFGVDPLADAPANIGYSSYHYTWNNPIKFIDPDGRHGEEIDDHILVNSSGFVTDVIEVDGPNRFFDKSTGDELFLNDAENNPLDSKLLSQKFEVGDQLYQNLPSQDMWDMIINAGFEPKKKLENFEFYDRYAVTKKLSMGAADFPGKLYSKYNLSSMTVSQGGTEFTGLPFKFDQSNVLYNPSDAGQYIWGAWMRANRFSYLQTWLGSNINEWKRGGDAPGDQKAIKAGFNYMSNWMKI